MTVTPFPGVSQGGVVAGATGPGGSERVVSQPAMGDPVGLLVIDSCHSTWLFDVPALRFRRMLKGLDVDPSLAATEWRPYVRLELAEDSDSFVVVLNEAGTRRIRSRRHGDDCEQCDGERTTELSVEDIRRLTNA